MALSKGEQDRLRDLMKEAVLMLCKNRLNYESKFRVEGLLGITVDDREVTLVNIVEEVIKETNLQICEVYQLSPMEEEQEVDPKENFDQEEPAMFPTPVVEVTPTTQKTRGRKRKPMRAVPIEEEEEELGEEEEGEGEDGEEEDLTSSDTPLDENNDENNLNGNQNGEKKGFFSPTVDQIIQEYERQQYNDSTSLLYMAKRKRRKYPDLTHLHTQGLLPIPSKPEGSSNMVSLLPKTVVTPNKEISRKVIIRRTGDNAAPTIVIKEEPADGDQPAEEPAITTGATPITIEPTTCFRDVSKVPVQAQALGTAPMTQAQTLSPTGTRWIKESILRQEGCFVSTRVMLRRHAILRGETVVSVMKAMSRDRTDVDYIGEFKQVGRIQVFYKCPPMLLHTKALKPFKLTLDQYSNYFFANPKPTNGTPSQWLGYLNSIMEGVPYNPHLFPIDYFDLQGAELEKISAKRRLLEMRFADGTDNDGKFMLGSIKEEES